MEKDTRKKGLDWLANLFGGGVGATVEAKRAKKKQLEQAVKEVSKKRKTPPMYVK